MNKFLVMVCLLSAAPVYAGTQYDNIYVTPHIEEHLPEFIAMEITKDFRESIADYNLHRKDPQYFAAKIKDPNALKLFNQITKKTTLPEIRQKDEMYYVIKAGKNSIEFNAELFLTRKYYLNGALKILKTNDLMAANETISPALFTQKIFNLLVAEAVAQDEADPDFDGSYKNLDTTKVLMASIVALDSSFKSRSILDKIPMMNDVADINAKNLVKKIEAYNSQCEENLSLQESMMKAPDSDWNNLGSLDRYSMMKSLQDTADPGYQATLGLVRKMAGENANSSYQRDKNLEGTFNADKKANSCEAMLANVFEESKNKSNVLSRYVDGGNSAKVAASNHPCTKMARLKLCLSKFHTQAVSINDFVRRRNGEAKEAGVQMYNVPENFPAENISR